MNQTFTIENILGTAFYYFVFIIILGIAACKTINKVDDKFVLVVSGVLLFLIAAFRAPDIDRDYSNYIASAKEISTPSDYFIHYSNWIYYEPLHYLIPSFIKLFFSFQSYPYVFFPLFALMGISLKYKAIFKMSSFAELSVIIYFSHFFLVHEMTQIRAGVATALFLFAIQAHLQKQYLRFFLLVVLAYMFQFTSILIISILFFSTRSFSIKKTILLFVGLLIVGIVSIQNLLPLLLQLNVSFFEKLGSQLYSYDAASNRINYFNAEFIAYFFFTVWLFMNYKKIEHKNPYVIILLKIQALSLITLIVFSPIAVVAFRVFEFFGVVSIITLPWIVYTFRSRFVGYTVLTVYSLLMLIVNIHVEQLLQPYNMIFFK